MSFIINFLITITIFVYLIILGASILKTEEERLNDDIEQENYLRDWSEKNEQKKRKRNKKI
ncbi:MAG: hypothetical protein ILA02_07420 [Clostridia bacterium]|nr:hypothetical protein [Clostridia bacterium]MBR0350837.1 hypothetical protein [Clostridia bacterium]